MIRTTVSLTVHTATATTRLEVAAGTSVRDLLDTTELRVRAACGGTGTCGACVVRLLGGVVNPATAAEYLKLTAEDRAQGQRLACQLRVLGDADIQLDHPAPASPWKSIPEEDLQPAGEGLPALGEHIYGVAVDLGTTHIRVSLWDRREGRRIATRRGPNPQASYGADVLNRLEAARGNPGRADELASLARHAIIEAIRDMLARDVGEVSPMLAEIGLVAVVGNTAMLALLTSHGGEALLDPAYWQQAIDCTPRDVSAWQAQWGLPNARFLLLPAVAGFIGSDLSADLVATRLTEGPPGSLLLDVGTNTEIALWDGKRLYASSVPGGPAFESGGISHGMPAEPGAIYRVTPRSDGGFACAVIGGGEARGFCGSGLVDAIAVLLAEGYLKPSGRFAKSPGMEGLQLQPGNVRTALAGRDVDAFQRAKAATSAAVVVLMAEAGMTWAQLRRICLCGAFGRTLDIDHARQIGLLPPGTAAVELHGDAALAGCERALLSFEGAELFATAKADLTSINMSLVSGYDDLYIGHLGLRPIPEQ